MDKKSQQKKFLTSGSAVTLAPGKGSEMLWMKMNNWLYASPGFPGGQGGQIRQGCNLFGHWDNLLEETIYHHLVRQTCQYGNNVSIYKYINLFGHWDNLPEKKTIFHHLVRQTIYQYVNSFGTGTIYSKFALNPPKKLTYETFCWSERLLTQFVLSVPLWNFSISDKLYFFGKTRQLYGVKSGLPFSQLIPKKSFFDALVCIFAQIHDRGGIMSSPKISPDKSSCQ